MAPDLRALFITGAQRSGTTLLEKLLSSHPDVHVFSQPFPLLFAETKSAFLARFGAPSESYPLGNLFRERRYCAADLDAYLETWVPDPEAIVRLFERMGRYSGQYTRFDASHAAAAARKLQSPGFASTLTTLWRELSAGPPNRLCGGKESFCEEFIPHLVANGVRCLVVVRDPRDVLASMNHGSGRQHAGRLKPTLFNLRNWRKSVAFVLQFETHPSFAWIRYEDLIHDPHAILDWLAWWLELDPFPATVLAGDLRDRAGAVWEANSSFGPRKGVSPASLGIHSALLAEEVVEFAASACFPEMCALGYDPGLSLDVVPTALTTFRDPYPLERSELDHYLNDPEELAAELERWQRLVGPAADDDEVWFVFRKAAEHLRRAVRRG